MAAITSAATTSNLIDQEIDQEQFAAEPAEHRRYVSAVQNKYGRIIPPALAPHRFNLIQSATASFIQHHDERSETAFPRHHDTALESKRRTRRAGLLLVAKSSVRDPNKVILGIKLEVWHQF